MDPAIPSAEDEALARKLHALSNPGRLCLLRQLRTGSVITEMRLKTVEGGGDPRTMSRQGIREHLHRLIEIGVVASRETERDWGPAVEYSLNHQALFAIAEEFRALARLRPAAEPVGATTPASARRTERVPEGPVLVLVKGLDEGRTYPLRAGAGEHARWVIGRSRASDIPLDYDPFVSAENAVVTREGREHVLADAEESRNGTLVNFRTLAKGERHVLRTGDLVGVGRSLLMFRA